MTRLVLAQLAARIHVNSTATLSPKGISNANGICCSPSTTGSPSTKGWPASEISPQQSQYRDRGQLTSQAAATGNREIDGAAGQRKRTATGSVPKATGIVNNAFPIVRVALTKHNPHRKKVSSERPKILQCWNWYGSDLQTLEDQAHWVLKKFHELVPI